MAAHPIAPYSRGAAATPTIMPTMANICRHDAAAARSAMVVNISGNSDT